MPVTYREDLGRMRPQRSRSLKERQGASWTGCVGGRPAGREGMLCISGVGQTSRRAGRQQWGAQADHPNVSRVLACAKSNILETLGKMSIAHIIVAQVPDERKEDSVSCRFLAKWVMWKRVVTMMRSALAWGRLEYPVDSEIGDVYARITFVSWALLVPISTTCTRYRCEARKPGRASPGEWQRCANHERDVMRVAGP
jgi:hypothetical protein